MTIREEKIAALFKKLISDFLSRINTNAGIITITHIDISKDLKFAKIFVSVYPEDKERSVLAILKNKEKEVRKFVGAKTKLKFLPDFKFETDKGEKNRQRIEELLNMAW